MQLEYYIKVHDQSSFPFSDHVDPDLVDYFRTVKDVVVGNIIEDQETCLQKLLCEMAAKEDPWIQHQMLKW